MGPEAIDGLLENAVADGVLPGVVATAGDRDGVLYEGAFGRLDVDGEQIVRADTIMRLASMTKAIASVAALQLIERGELELTQPVASILPAFGELQVLEGFDGEVPRLRAPAGEATVANLLTHTSGLGYWFGNPELLRCHAALEIPDPLTLRRGMLDAPLVADPGTRWEYGTSTDWLGEVIEAVSGDGLAAYCDAHIFAPLGMADATFQPTDEQRSRMMALHARLPGGGLGISTVAIPERPEFWSGGGGAYATGGDYLRFMRALLRGGELDGERILRPETVELAFSDHLDGIAFPTVMASAIPELTNEVPSMPIAQGFGLGFHLVLEDIPGMRHAGTGDWAGLFNCYYWIDRAASVAGTFMTQVLPFFDMPIVERAIGFEAAVYAGIGALASA